jgi:hypothetical protein
VQRDILVFLCRSWLPWTARAPHRARLHRDSSRGDIANRERRVQRNFSTRLLLSIPDAMNDSQKKLQDLSDSYQNLQAGTQSREGSQRSLISWWGRTGGGGRLAPEARIATAGEHYGEKGGQRLARRKDNTKVSFPRNLTSLTTMQTSTSRLALCC